jgi:hypothetical protein
MLAQETHHSQRLLFVNISRPARTKSLLASGHGDSRATGEAAASTVRFSYGHYVRPQEVPELKEMIANFKRFRELVDHCIDVSIQIAVQKFQLQCESPNPCTMIPDRGQRLAPLQTSRSTVNREMRPL